MKVNVSFDMTPEECRRLFGLPDVQQLQKEIIDKTLEKMNMGEEGYDPMSLYGPMFNGGMSAMNQFQQTLFAMMQGKSPENSNE